MQLKVLVGKLACSVGTLNILKQTFPQSVVLLVQLYYAIVHPLLLYV